MALHPKIIDLTLDRVWRLLEALGHPERSIPPVIHIAGTNGKGSTQAMIRAGLEASGARVQAYTSPHLARFHERIRLSDGLISEPALQAVLAECEEANGGEAITYFEITTVAALLAFSRDRADYCLLEVGLGGRLDATNVITQPAATAITPVSLDHQQFLGDTLAAIASEKAGILKPGVFCAVGPQRPEAMEAIEDRAARVSAPLSVADQDWQVWEEHGRVAYQDQNGLLDLPMPALIGAHQVENAGVALAVLRHLGVSDDACSGALANAVWPARMQRLRSGPLVDAAQGAELWLDGGHNPAAGAALAEALTRLPDKQTVLICGMLRTKDAAGYFAPLAKIAPEVLTVSIPGEAATLSAQETRDAAVRAGLNADMAGSVLDAVKQVAERYAGARILICGSLYLAGVVLRENG